jgi:hypothetical protein
MLESVTNRKRMGEKVSKRGLLPAFFLFLTLLSCGYLEPVSPSSTPAPLSSDTPAPVDTDTPLPPSDTPQPTPTLPTEIWLDPQEYEITIQHPQSTAQPEWVSSSELKIPVEDFVGGVVFTVEEYNGIWGTNSSSLVEPANSLTKDITSRDYPIGTYCISDYFAGFNPETACALIAPGAIVEQWIRPYFAGYKSEVGMKFTTGGCDPAFCLTTLKITGIRLILYKPEEAES